MEIEKVILVSCGSTNGVRLIMLKFSFFEKKLLLLKICHV